jgi:hypothetical protein
MQCSLKKRKVDTMRLSARPIRVFSLVVLLAVTNVYVFATGTLPNSSEAASGNVLIGKLVTTSNRPVVVNGAEAITGSVILSGTQLTTSPVSFATVKVDKLGTVSIAPSSNVLLSFDAHSINVKVISGDAVVNAVDGVKGTVVTAAGKSVLPSAPAPAGGNSAKNWGIAGVAVGSAAFIWAIIAWNKANDADDNAAAANAAAASLASQLAALRTCLAGQTTSPLKLCTSF